MKHRSSSTSPQQWSSVATKSVWQTYAARVLFLGDDQRKRVITNAIQFYGLQFGNSRVPPDVQDGTEATKPETISVPATKYAICASPSLLEK